MPKTTTIRITIKMHKMIREHLDRTCANGYGAMKEFLEKAIANQIAREAPHRK
jgi:hypothetical protein